MKKRILIITLIGLSFGIKAQNTFPTSGNVGIGTTMPETKLHIKGDGLSLRLSPNNYVSLGAEIGMDFRQLTHNGAFRKGGAIKSISTDSYTGGLGTSYDSDLVLYSAGDGILVEGLRINSLGYVGIGTTDTKGFKLGVKGKIAAEEVKVALHSNWSDFVFYNDYKLPTLQEVETHIKEKGHLKDIPSAKDVKENGIFLGEMVAKLLQKIEELTLYTIAQEKEIKNLKKENEQLDQLKQMMLILQSRLDKVESKK